MTIARLDLGPLQVNLDEFFKIVLDLISAKLDGQASGALRDMINEANISYKTVVDSLTPFYELNTDYEFQTRFPQLYSTFKNTYLNRTGDIRTSCHRVQVQLDRLRQEREWQKRFPYIKKSLEKLNVLATSWLANDESLARVMDNFVHQVNSTLDLINNEFLNRNVSNARTELFSYLFTSEEDFLRIKSELSVLDGIGERLK